MWCALLPLLSKVGEGGVGGSTAKAHGGEGTLYTVVRLMLVDYAP